MRKAATLSGRDLHVAGWRRPVGYGTEGLAPEAATSRPDRAARRSQQHETDRRLRNVAARPRRCRLRCRRRERLGRAHIGGRRRQRVRGRLRQGGWLGRRETDVLRQPRRAETLGRSQSAETLESAGSAGLRRVELSGRPCRAGTGKDGGRRRRWRQRLPRRDAERRHASPHQARTNRVTDKFDPRGDMAGHVMRNAGNPMGSM
jgi:hypothetical protein